jgi:glycosyltransferase involved in cell wall biosynthesis
MMTADTFISVVAPVHDEPESLEVFVQEVLAVLQAHFPNFELVMVDAGSSAVTVALTTRLTQQYANVRLIRLTHCFSPDIAAIAGLESSIGDFVAVLHPDSDPPHAIPRLVQEAEHGAEVVQGIAIGLPRRGLLFRFCQAGFYFICNRLLRLDMPPSSSTLCGFTRRAVNAILRIKQKQPRLALLSCSVGFPRRQFEYKKVFRAGMPRQRGLLTALDQGIGLLVTHSMSPLRFISYVGMFAGLINLLYVVYVVVVNLVKRNVAEGWTTLSLQNSLMFMFVFLILVLMAEYTSRILEESKDRPLYHVLEELGGSSVSTIGRNVLEHSPSLINAEITKESGRAA